MLKEVGEYYIVVTTSRAILRSVYEDGESHKIKWSDVLNNLKFYAGYEVVVEVEDESGELIVKEIRIPVAGVKY